MKTTVITSLDALLDEVLVRFQKDPLDEVDTVRDEVRGTYDMLDGWGTDDSSDVSKAIKLIDKIGAGKDTRVIADEDKVVISTSDLDFFRESFDALQGDVTVALGNLHATLERLDTALSDYDLQATL